MGGSGGGSISESGPSRGGGAGFSDGLGGGVSAPPTEACPETRTALLVDVAAAGNGAYALTLPSGSTLTLAQDGNRFLVAAGGHTLGWLPGDLSRLITLVPRRRRPRRRYPPAARILSASRAMTLMVIF